MVSGVRMGWWGADTVGPPILLPLPHHLPGVHNNPIPLFSPCSRGQHDCVLPVLGLSTTTSVTPPAPAQQ